MTGRPHSRFLVCACGIFLAQTFAADPQPSPDGVAQLEAYKRRLGQLQSRQADPARAAQLRQMQQVLSLMQRSIVIEEKKADGAAEPDAPSDPPIPPAPPENHAISPETRKTPRKAATVPEESTPVPAVPVPPVPLPQPVKADPKAPEPATVPPETPSRKIPHWFFQAEATFALGYQENLLRSAFSDLDSSLIHGEIDLRLLNTRRRNNRMLALGRYTRTHFLDEPSVRDEDLLFLLGEAEHRMTDHWWLGVNTSFFSAHQPFDDPDLLDLNTTSLPLRFRQFAIAPQVSWEPAREHRVLMRGGYRQEDTHGLQFESEDNDQWFFNLGYTFEPSRHHRIRLDYQYSHADYDERLARQPSGEPLEETLELTKQEWQASYRRTWERASRRWHAESRVRLVIDDDQRGGYDDAARLEIRGRAGVRYGPGSELRAELRYGKYFYDERQVSSIDARRRQRSYWAGSLTWEHRLTSRAALWLNYEFRDNAGNKTADHYGVHRLYTGIRFRF